jgi:hypothetical protein
MYKQLMISLNIFIYDVHCNFTGPYHWAYYLKMINFYLGKSNISNRSRMNKTMLSREVKMICHTMINLDPESI